MPVARVFADSGDTYFIGDEAERITCMEGISPYVPVLSGDLTYEFVRDTLFDLVTRVREDDFWRALVTAELPGFEWNRIAIASDDGVILKDRAFVATSRVYDDDLAQVDPVNYEGHNDCGYIMRIVLPAGTKGIDCRRCTGRTLDNGINAVYILPPDSSFEIQHVDDLHRLIYAKYILP